MKVTEIEILLNKYFEGETSLQEEEQLKQYFSSEDIPEELQSYTAHFQFFSGVKNAPTESLPDDEKLFAKIDKEAPEEGMGKEVPLNPGHSSGWLRYAAGLGLLLLGFAAGYLVNNLDRQPTSNLAVTADHNVNKNKLLVNLADQASASERILAINQSGTMEQVDPEVIDALVKTMNYDENINVRLAAIEALSHFIKEEPVKKAILDALEIQDNPMVQIALIDMIVKIGERNAIPDMQRLMIDDNTQEVVKQRAQEGIAVLM